MATIRPVDVLIDDTNRPVVWRAPMVIIRIAAEQSSSGQTLRAGGSEFKRKAPKRQA